MRANARKLMADKGFFSLPEKKAAPRGPRDAEQIDRAPENIHNGSPNVAKPQPYARGGGVRGGASKGAPKGKERSRPGRTPPPDLGDLLAAGPPPGGPPPGLGAGPPPAGAGLGAGPPPMAGPPGGAPMGGPPPGMAHGGSYKGQVKQPNRSMTSGTYRRPQKMLARGGSADEEEAGESAADERSDRQMVTRGVHQHEGAMHPGHKKTALKLRGGGLCDSGGKHEGDQSLGRHELAKGGQPKKWVQKAIKKPGALRASLGVKEGQKIPAARLEAATHSDNPKTRRRAVLAKTMRSWHHAEGGPAGGKPVKLAMGGIGKQRRGVANKSGEPILPPTRKSPAYE